MSYVFHTSKNGKAVVTANVYWVVKLAEGNPDEVLSGPYLDIGMATSEAENLQRETALGSLTYDVYATQLDLIKATNQ